MGLLGDVVLIWKCGLLYGVLICGSYKKSSWREQQKEEAESLRLSVQEDLEELRQEEGKLECKRQPKKLRTH